MKILTILPFCNENFDWFILHSI